MDDNKALLDRAKEIVAALRCMEREVDCTDCHYYNGITCEPKRLDADAVALLEARAAQLAKKDKEIIKLKLEKELMRQEWDASQVALSRMTAERDAATALVDELHEMLRPGEDGQGYGYAATNGVAYMVYAMIDEWRGAQGEA